MPIYEYRCAKCGEFEVTQRITESPLKKCPTCKGKVTKLISNTSFQLKGSGWYVTDYGRAGSKGSTSKTDSESSKKSDGESSSSKSESSDTKASQSSDSKSSDSKSSDSKGSSSKSADAKTNKAAAA